MPCLSASCALAGLTERTFAPATAAPAMTLNALRRLNLMRSRSLRHFRCLVLVPPPDRRKRGAAVFWHGFRTAEPVPSRRADVRIRPLGHHIEVPQHNPVERLAGRYQIGTVLSKYDFFDQRIDGRTFNADEVTRAGPVGRLRAQQVALFVARRE